MREIQRQLLMGVTPQADSAVVEKAADYLFRHRPGLFKGNGRRINRFMVGADPECVFETRNGGMIHAVSVGLLPALAYGADQNTRLVEMRATPSRSTFEVVASLLATMRWMYRGCRPSQDLVWRAGAFAHSDGIGGHVHFGRKRTDRPSEVSALDGLAKVMRSAGLFPGGEWTRRASGDQFSQRYGLYGDIRLQRHGYEYRTLPSWLSSPHLAFLVLTLSKLVVIDTEITRSWNENMMNPWALLTGLARFYAGRDDDAWMLYTLMGNPGLFIHTGGCFRWRWGLTGRVAELPSMILPAVIPAQETDREDLMALFLGAQPLPMRELQPDWVCTIPERMDWAIRTIPLGRAAGAGELLYDMAMPGRNNPHGYFSAFEWSNGSSSPRVHVPAGFAGAGRLAQILPEMSIREGSSSTPYFHFSISRDWRVGKNLERLRRALFSGVFPLWRVCDVAEDSLDKWLAEQPRALEGNLARGIAPEEENFMWPGAFRVPNGMLDPDWSDEQAEQEPPIPGPIMTVPMIARDAPSWMSSPQIRAYSRELLDEISLVPRESAA